MSSPKYDIYVDQGSTLKLWLEYKYRGGTGINLQNYKGYFQVRKSIYDDQCVLFFTGNGVTGGGVTGEFTIGTNGINGVGGISFNVSQNGILGNTGGILIRADKTTMKNVPAGKHFYDLKLENTSGEIKTIVGGAFNVNPEITRL